VPRERFLTAGRAWEKLRRGEGNPNRFGVSVLGLTGMWFVAGSLLRDFAALDMEEMLPWDYWGPARNFRPGTEISPEWLSRLDHSPMHLSVWIPEVQAPYASMRITPGQHWKRRSSVSH
jgi:hypothetical protein